MEIDSDIIYFDRESRYKWFWNIIEKSERKSEKLLSILEQLPRRKIMFFQEAFDNYYYVTLETDPENYEQLRETIYKAVDKCYDTRNLPYPDAIITQWTWDIIRKAENSTEKMTEILMGMTKDEIYWFDKEFKEAARLLTWPIFFRWLNGLSEDGMEDLSLQIVSRGEEFYLNIWHNPEQIPQDEDYNIASYQYIPREVFEKKFGVDIFDYEEDYWDEPGENQ